MKAHITTNTTKEYPCTMCGSSGNIIREGDDPRLKCNSCGFMYDASASIQAEKEGAIPDGPPPVLEEAKKEVELAKYTPTPMIGHTSSEGERLPLIESLPRTPTHVLLSKDRKFFEFVTKRTLKKEVLKWTAGGRTFDLFELTIKKVDARVDIT